MTTDDDAKKKKENEAADEPMDMEAVEDKSTSGLPNKKYVASNIVADYEYIPVTLHATDNIFWANLKVEYAHRGAEFICKVLEYQVRSNGRNKGDVEFYLSWESGAGDVKRLTENAIQDGEWHDLLHTEWLYPFGVPVTIGFDYIYDIADGGDKILKTYVIKEFKPLIPILHITSNFVSSIFDVTGENGIAGYTLVIDDGSPELGSKVLPESGSWSVPVTVAEANTQRIRAHQKYLHHVSERSPAITVYRSRITSPTPGSILLIKDLVFAGTAAPGTNVRLVNDKNHGDYLTETVVVGHSGTTWQALPIKPPPSGPVSVRALLKLPNQRDLYTEVVNFSFMGVPEIVSPPALTVVDQNFRLEGKNGFHRARFQVFPDLGDSPVGWEIVGDEEGFWTGLVGLPPGPVSLVVEQDLNGLTSGRSQPRGFRIRPPKLETPTFEFPVAETVQFSGTGHYNPRLATRIRFIVESYPGETPPNTPDIVTVQNDGSWGVTATGWGLGNYSVQVVQEIADNAGGWIESLPLEFTFNKALPDVSNLKHTVEYRPTFSGKGFNGATVHVRHPNSANLAAPTTVVSANEWSTTASAIWGPSNNREVHVKQILDGQWSPTWCVLTVTIHPLAPGLNVPSEEGLSPVFSGTGYSGAEVHINFSGDSQTYKAPVVAEVWTFQRDTAFIADIPHTIEVKQVAEGLDSPKAERTFTVYPVVEQPVITYPLEGSEVPRDLSVTGSGGMAGATMRLWDDRYGKYLTPPQLLANDGEWVIALTGLAFDEHVIRAEQTIYSRPFKLSEQRKFKAVVPPPEITCPNGGRKLPRTSTLTGKGMPHARVEVWMLGETSAPLTEANVDGAGNWSAEVTLPVGDKTIWALQIYDDNGVPQQSRDSDRVTYQVVPKAPDIESPTTDEHAGRVLVVSGFGVAGDTVTVKVGTEQQSEPVRADRTWSVRLELGQPGGDSLLEVVSALGEFESEPATRPIVLRTYLPTVEVPAPGSWVVNPVLLSGSGRQGVGEVVSWFDPDLVLGADIHVDPQDGWQAQARLSLMTGGQWSRFRQRLDDVEKGSDWVVSKRYEVHPGSSKLS